MSFLNLVVNTVIFYRSFPIRCKKMGAIFGETFFCFKLGVHSTTHSILPPWAAGALVRSGKGFHGRAPLAHVQKNDMFLTIEGTKCYCFLYAAGGDATFSTNIEMIIVSYGSIFYIIIYKFIN